jgi:hypothetical protein
LKEKLKRDLDKLLTQKDQAPETTTDEILMSKQIIEKFLLVPKALSGREIRMKVKLVGKAFAASKALCSAFNLEFGRTIGRTIKVIEPSGYNDAGLQELYATSKQVDAILDKPQDSELDLYAKLQFAERGVGRIIASYKSEYSYDEGESYGEPGLVYDPADGKIILLFSKMKEALQ